MDVLSWLGESSLSAVSRAALMLGLAVVAVLGWAIYRAQRSGRRIGGVAAPAKAAWLAFVVYLWFVVTPVLALEPALGAAQRLILGAFATNMWLRGLIELVMLYGTRSWRPAYGIAHDLASIALLLSLVVAHRGALWPAPTPLDAWTLLLLGVVVASLTLETWYAHVFGRIVGERTRGHDAVWFAADDDPRFARVVRLTARANVVLVAALALFLLGAL